MAPRLVVSAGLMNRWSAQGPNGGLRCGRAEAEPELPILMLSTSRSVALLRKILCFDPSKRFTAVEALRDPYLCLYFSDEDDHTSQPDKHAEWLQEVASTEQLDNQEHLQNLLFQEMLLFHPEAINVQWGASASPSRQASVQEREMHGQLGQQSVAQLVAAPEHSRAAHPMSSGAPTMQYVPGMPPPGYSYHPAGGIVPTPMPGQPMPMLGQPMPMPGQPMSMAGQHPVPISGPPGPPQRQHHYQSPPSSFYPPGFGPGFAYPPHPAVTWHGPTAPSATMPPSAQPQMIPHGAAGQPAGFAPPQPQMAPGQRSMPPHGGVTWMHSAQTPP